MLLVQLEQSQDSFIVTVSAPEISSEMVCAFVVLEYVGDVYIKTSSAYIVRTVRLSLYILSLAATTPSSLAYLPAV